MPKKTKAAPRAEQAKTTLAPLSFGDQVAKMMGWKARPPQEQIDEANRASSAKPVAPGEIRITAVANLVESPFNARRDFGDLKSLAASISTMGLLQPIQVREVDGRYQIIFGHRRARAAKLAGLTKVPVSVVTMTDTQVREAQLVENLQRQDVNAMEEAATVQALHQEHHYSAEQIAARVGKSKAWVYSRLRLCTLAPEVKRAVASGRLPDTVAIAIARIPQKLQARAAEKVAPEEGEAMSTRAALEWVAREFTQTLKLTPFALDDKDLVPEAGSCVKCPKRSGSVPGLFDDLKGSDVCTDTACFKLKVKAQGERERAKLERLGVEIVPPAVSRREFAGERLSHDSIFVGAEDPAPRDSKRRTWAQLIRACPTEVKPFALYSPAGLLVGAFRRDEALAALAPRHSWARETKEEVETVAAATAPDQSAELEAKRAMRAKVRDNLRDRYRSKREGMLPALRRIATMMDAQAGWFSGEATAAGYEGSADALEHASAEVLVHLLAAAVFAETTESTWAGYSDALLAYVSAEGLELATLEAVAADPSTPTPTTDDLEEVATKRAAAAMIAEVYNPKVRKLEIQDVEPEAMEVPPEDVTPAPPDDL